MPEVALSRISGRICSSIQGDAQLLFDTYPWALLQPFLTDLVSHTAKGRASHGRSSRASRTPAVDSFKGWSTSKTANPTTNCSIPRRS